MAKNEDSAISVDKKVVKETEKLMETLIEMFDVDAEVSVEPNSYTDVDGNEEEFVDVNIDGEDIGVLIGYMGRNLRSLQRVVSLLLNHRLGTIGEEGKFVRVIIDVSGYRDKRESSLERMALQIRDEVVASGEPVDLPSMSAYERRVIHTTLSDHEDVTTESFGEGRSRYVRVFPVEGDGDDILIDEGFEPEDTEEDDAASDDDSKADSTVEDGSDESED